MEDFAKAIKQCVFVDYGKEADKSFSRARFRSSDLWVMGPARFHCATLLIPVVLLFLH